MIVVSNRIPVNEGFEEQFEALFRNRGGVVDKAPGFIRFEVLRPIQGEYYQVLTYWKDSESFENWMKSPEFQQGHGQSRPPEGMYKGRNVIEIGEVIQESGQPLG